MLTSSREMMSRDAVARCMASLSLKAVVGGAALIAVRFVVVDGVAHIVQKVRAKARAQVNGGASSGETAETLDSPSSSHQSPLRTDTQPPPPSSPPPSTSLSLEMEPVPWVDRLQFPLNPAIAPVDGGSSSSARMLLEDGVLGNVSLCHSAMRSTGDCGVAIPEVERLGVLICGLFKGHGPGGINASVAVRSLFMQALPFSWASAVNDMNERLHPGGNASSFSLMRTAREHGHCQAYRYVNDKFKETAAEGTAAVSAVTAVVGEDYVCVGMVGDCICVLGYCRRDGDCTARRLMPSDMSLSMTNYRNSVALPTDSHAYMSPSCQGGDVSPSIEVVEREADLKVLVLTTTSLGEELTSKELIQMALSEPAREGKSAAQRIVRLAEERACRQGRGLVTDSIGGLSALVVDFR